MYVCMYRTCDSQKGRAVHFKMLYISSNSWDVLELYKSLAVPFVDIRTTPIVNRHGQVSVFADFKRLNVERFYCG